MQHLPLHLAIAQRLEGVTAQEMYDTLSADGYDIPFTLDTMTRWERKELERQYLDYIL